jgi:spermidine synthase
MMILDRSILDPRSSILDPTPNSHLPTTSDFFESIDGRVLFTVFFAVIRDGWFHERVSDSLWSGQAQTLRVVEVLERRTSAFQEILAFRSESHGVVLALDGVVQVTERDEFAYQEMLTHVPLFAHRAPERVLVIGGGDGGCLREIARHASVREIVICELDADVIDVAKRFLPSLAVGFSDPRVSVHVGDGAAYMATQQAHFDVIVVDSSDPIGPAEQLFEKPFYMAMKAALRPGGLVATQCESMWLHSDIIARVLAFCRQGGFATAEWAWCSIPTYPSGTIGFCLCRLDEPQTCARPLRAPDAALQQTLRYYTPRVHEASFVLPAFMERALRPSLT